MKRFVCLLLAVTMAGCASTHNGAVVDSPIVKFSFDRVSDLSDEVHVFATVTVENRSENWIRIRGFDILSPQPDQYPYNIIAGEDLVAWAESSETKLQMARHNSDLAVFSAVLAGLAVVTLAAAQGKSGSGLAATGAATALGAAAVSDYNTWSRKAFDIENPRRVPEKHLMRPFAVPAKGFAKRWVLIHMPKGPGSLKAKMKVETEDGKSFVSNLPMKDLIELGGMATR